MPQWPAVATLMPDKTREHGHMLGMYLNTTLTLMTDSQKPPIETFKAFLQATLKFITKTKQEPNNQTILEETQKAADASLQRESYIEEQITAIKNAQAIAERAS